MISNEKIKYVNPHTPQVEAIVKADINTFGYVVNVILASVWFLVFLIVLVMLYFRKNSFHKAIPFILFELVCVLLGGFHAYVLYSDSYEKEKKNTSGLVTRIIHAWPLVLGTVIYTVCVCFDAFKIQKSGNISFKFSYYRLMWCLNALNIPLTVCACFLTEDSYWNVFNAWTVDANEETEISPASENVVFTPEHAVECRIVGFIVSILLAFFWFMLAFIGGSVFTEKDGVNDSFDVTAFFFVHIASLAVFGVNFYTLCTPKYDSGEYSGGFFKKNWLIVSGCSITSLALFSLSIVKKDYIMIPIFVTVASICSCLIMRQSNSSQSCTSCFKPWNMKIVSEEERNPETNI